MKSLPAALLLPAALALGLAFCVVPSAFAEAASPKAASAESYLAAVRSYGDTVLALGMDHYGPAPTPLFVDGIDQDTHEPMKWKSRNGHEWVISNFASQQTLLRVLVGLTALTGDSRYRDAAVAATRYALDHLDHDGLLAWGGHMAYNASEGTITFAEEKGPVHELKSHYPYYELLWQVDPVKTRTFMENIWRGHILDWSILDFNRHAPKLRPGKLWDSEYSAKPVFFWGKGLTFHNAGSDLYYDAAILAKLSGDEKPLVWSKRLAHRYVETRDPKIGISGEQFSQDAKGMCFDPEHPGAEDDRARYFYGPDFPGHVVLESTLFPAYGDTPSTAEIICQMNLADELGAKGHEFSQWSVEELTAWGKAAFRKADCSFIPMLLDGTSMEGYVVKKDGYFGPKGRILKAGKAEPRHFWAYAMAYRQSRDPFLWEMARDIALGNGLGDIGATPTSPEEKLSAGRADPAALFGFLELYQATDRQAYLEAAEKAGSVFIDPSHFSQGLFVGSNQRFASFKRIEPLALLHLVAAMKGRTSEVPKFPGGVGFYAADYGLMGTTGDDHFLSIPRRKPGADLAVSGVQATARHGQVFLTWKEAETPNGTTFNVYVSTSPIADLSQAKRIGHHIEQRSARDWWADPASFAKGTPPAEPVGFRIANDLPRLSPRDGLFVHTPGDREKEKLYFAVTSSDADGHEQAAIIAGANSLKDGVLPAPGPVEPIWQKEGQPPPPGTGKGMPLWLEFHAKGGVVANMEYLVFGDKAMGWREGLPFKFSVRVEKDAVMVRPTDRTWINRPHDEAADGGTPAIWTFWYGYNSHIYDRKLMGSGVPTNYTERKNIWILNWVQQRYQPDPARWSCSGSSMGGCGTVSFGLHHPEWFAACHAHVPIVSYTSLGSKSALRLAPSCWTGPVPPDLKTNENVPLLDRMNSERFVTESTADLPFLFLVNGRQDGSIPWQNNPPFYRALSKAQRGFSAYWDNGSHSTCGKEAPADVKAWLARSRRFKLNESYPAFSHTSTDRNPGNGSPTDGDTIGWINRGLDWKDIEDAADHFSIVLLADALDKSYPVTTDVTLRRVQHFVTRSGDKLKVRIGDATPVQLSADEKGKITIPKVTVPSAAGVRVLVTRE